MERKRGGSFQYGVIFFWTKIVAITQVVVAVQYLEPGLPELNN
jgi:hypothetical protein